MIVLKLRKAILCFIWSTLRWRDYSAAIQDLFSFLGIRTKQYHKSYMWEHKWIHAKGGGGGKEAGSYSFCDSSAYGLGHKSVTGGQKISNLCDVIYKWSLMPRGRPLIIPSPPCVTLKPPFLVDLVKCSNKIARPLEVPDVPNEWELV